MKGLLASLFFFLVSIPQGLAPSVTAYKAVQTDFSKAREAVDGHVWEHKEYQRQAVTVIIRYYPSRAALLAAYRKEGWDTSPGLTLYAYTTMSKDRSTCRINTIDPDVRYEPEYIGHELMHCFHGNWHPNHLKRIGYEKTR